MWKGISVLFFNWIDKKGSSHWYFILSESEKHVIILYFWHVSNFHFGGMMMFMIHYNLWNINFADLKNTIPTKMKDEIDF